MNTDRENLQIQSNISRRRFIAASTVVATAAWLAPQRLLAQQEGVGIVDMTRKHVASAAITVEPVRGNISVVIGSGGNIGVCSGQDGKVLVDAGMTGSRQRIAAALARMSKYPTTDVINTHWHFDHTEGNEWLQSAGATITAHENTLTRLSIPQRVADWHFTFPPVPARALPTNVFKEELTLRRNGTTLVLKHYGPAHTDTDISVYFADEDVLHTGDTWWNGSYPFIDYSTGGSITGMIRATEINLARITDKSLIIPGHGPVGRKSDLAAFLAMLVTIHDKVAALKQQGCSPADVVAAKPTADYDAKWGGYFINPAFFTRLIYAGA